MSARTLAENSSVPTARRHLSELCRLAAPVVLARAGNTALNVTNLVLIGHAGPEQLAVQSVGFSIVNTLQMIGLGLLTGTLVAVAGAFGRGDRSECGQVWRRSLAYALILGAAGALVTTCSSSLLRATGQSAAFAEAAGHVSMILGLSLPAQLLFTATSFFLEGIGRPHPGMVMMVLGVMLNFCLGWLLVFGHWGAPALGAEGTALATLIVRIVLALGLIGFALRFRGAERFGATTSFRGSWRSWAFQRRIGYADGLSLGIESGAFTAMNLMAGLVGTADVGAYTIALSVLGIVFTFALGISSATAVLVSRAFGRRSARDVQLAGWIGLVLNTAVMILAGVPLLVSPEAIARLYSTDSSVVATAAPLVAIVAVTMLGDGGQRVVAQSLRGCLDAWFPTALHLLSYAAIMVPLGWLLAFPLGLRSVGLLLAIAIASFSSIGVLAIRFWRLTVQLRVAWQV
jgi:multidrug resistance protein, MATE family